MLDSGKQKNLSFLLKKYEHDPDHANHVKDLALILFDKTKGALHEFSDRERVLLETGALLHDIGKMKIPKEILYKPGKLSNEEFSLIKDHAVLGYDFLINTMKLPDYVAKGALEHHERWHGDGYPHGLRGKQISEFGQIIGIADVYDALVSEKIYRGSVQSNDAIRIMLTEESKSFNPEIFHKFAFLAVVKVAKLGSQ